MKVADKAVFFMAHTKAAQTPSSLYLGQHCAIEASQGMTATTQCSGNTTHFYCRVSTAVFNKYPAEFPTS